MGGYMKHTEETKNMWKGGITDKNQAFRTSSAYLKWRDNTFKRDNYTCQVCLVRGKKIRSHHIKKFSELKEMRLTPYNGITICEECDLKFVLRREHEWERFFFDNLLRRGIIGKPFGWELFVDAYGCDNSVIDDINVVYNFLEDAVHILGVHTQSPPYVFHSPGNFPDKAGISAWVPLIESSIAIHTLTVKNFVSIDYYTCSKFTPEAEKKLLRLAESTFFSRKIDSYIMLRGLDYYGD